MYKLVLIMLMVSLVFVAGCVSNIPFLGGPPSFMTKCTSDSDCVAVSAAKNCCSACKDTTVNSRYSAEWAYANEKYCQTQNTNCSVAPCDHSSKPLCISGSCVINKTVVE